MSRRQGSSCFGIDFVCVYEQRKKYVELTQLVICPDLENIVLITISTECNDYSGEVTQGGLIPRVLLLKGDMRFIET